MNLVDIAMNCRKNCHCPYSHYPVSAALETVDGKIYSGVNIEKPASGSTVCAERVAVFKAVSEGDTAFTKMVVITPDGGAPCGSCLQVLAHFKPIRIDLYNDRAERVMSTSVQELLPVNFNL
jgi:cytidine deaminase